MTPPPQGGLPPLVVRTVFLLVAVSIVAFTVRSSGERDLLVPVEGVSLQELRNNFWEARDGGRVHAAIDIAAERGTPVVATADGIVHRMSESERGGTGLYLIDPPGGRCYYYGHLDAYASGLEEGRHVARGEVLGFVGSSGNASEDAPHLHFAVYELAAANRCGVSAVNPLSLFSGENASAR